MSELHRPGSYMRNRGIKHYSLLIFVEIINMSLTHPQKLLTEQPSYMHAHTHEIGRTCSTHGETRNRYNILVGKTEGTRPLARLRLQRMFFMEFKGIFISSTHNKFHM
jgi:hypothetical protein